MQTELAKDQTKGRGYATAERTRHACAIATWDKGQWLMLTHVQKAQQRRVTYLEYRESDDEC